MNHELVYYDSVYITFRDEARKADKNGSLVVGKADKNI